SSSVPSALDDSARSSASMLSLVTSGLMIWPPSKAISILIRSASATRNHLREDAMNGVGMDESNLEPEETVPGLRVDQLDPSGLELCERGPDVVALVGDVVHPRAAPGEEPAHRGVVAERGEELEAVRAHADRRRLDALVGDGVATLDAGAEQTLVGAD